MIEYVYDGDIFASGADVLVNPTNTQGVMGRGLALEFKKRFPTNFLKYARWCEEGSVKPGATYPFFNEDSDSPEWLINFVTKDHWRQPSKLEWIGHGLSDLCCDIDDMLPPSVAIPALGCGLGGLKWADVKPLIEDALGDLEGVRILVYEPKEG